MFLKNVVAFTFLIGVSKCLDIENPNILFIILDDLRPAIGGYGDENAVTPNIDSLIAKGHYFTKAYVQQSICAPSRNSILTSRRPDTLHLYDFYNYWRDFAGNYTTLPQYLKDFDYETISVGKVFHPGMSSNFTDDYPMSWSEVPFHPTTEKYMNKPFCIDRKTGTLKRNVLCPVEVHFQPGNTLPDIESILKAKEILKTYENPYFLAVGLHKPHIPFQFPSKYLNYHAIEKFQDSDLSFKPYGVPEAAWNPFNDVRNRDDVKLLNISFPYGPIPNDFKRLMKQHYYASVTYVDDLIGELLEDVDFTNTVIVLTSDHGWSLGEHAEWSKFSNFEVAVNIPLIVYSPQYPGNSHKIESIVESLDLFPTIVDLAGLPPVPLCRGRNIETCTEGKSLLPLISGSLNDEKDENVAFSQYPRPGDFPTESPDSDKPKLYQIQIMGYSIRTRQFRYTAWIGFDPKTFKRDWIENHGEELYDHILDPAENMNLIDRNELKNIIDWLKQMLQQQFP